MYVAPKFSDGPWLPVDIDGISTLSGSKLPDDSTSSFR
jgi:hypothetical protein